jgi:hypothetical protein
MASNYSSESQEVFAAIDRAAESGEGIVSLSDGVLMLRLPDEVTVRIKTETMRWYTSPKPGRKKSEKGQINKNAYRQKVEDIVAAILARR